jgi:carboxypeptidase Taq
VEVPNDRQGCLQDSHWSGGSIGYFPSYALGSAYGAQMLHKMEEDVPGLWSDVQSGDLGRVTAWLKDKIHQYGSLLTPAQVLENACGQFDPSYYTDYLIKKYSGIYHIPV